MGLSAVICPSARSCVSLVCLGSSEDVLKTGDEATGVRAELQLKTLPSLVPAPVPDPLRPKIKFLENAHRQ